jgi:hypothetical protein
VPDYLSEEWLRDLDAAFRAAARLSGLGPLVIEQVVRGVPDRGEVRYRLVLGPDGAHVDAGAPGPEPGSRADLRLSTDYATSVAIATGVENAQTALAHGRLRIGGDIETLAAHAAAFTALDDVTAALRKATTYPAP